MDLRFIEEKRRKVNYRFCETGENSPKGFWRGIWHGQKKYNLRGMKFLEKDIDILIAGLDQQAISSNHNHSLDLPQSGDIVEIWDIGHQLAL